MANRIFVLASVEFGRECIEKAHKWISEPNQKTFSSAHSTAVSAVAEFLANEKGFTLYECNAKYPKSK